MQSEIVAIAACFIIGTWLTTVFVALKNLSWGGIKKLDGKKEKDLIFKAEQWLEKRNSYRITLRLLVLINMAFLAVNTHEIVKDQLKTDYGQLESLLLCIVVTYLFVLLTEAVSILFTNNGWLVLRASMPFIRLIHLVPAVFTLPAVHLHNRLENRESEDDDEKARMEDEIEALLDHEAHSSNGVDDFEAGIEETTGRMIRGILDLDETLVKEIMTPRVDAIGVEVSTAIKDVRKTIVGCGHSRIPVYERTIDNILGVVYSKNMLDDDTVNEHTDLKEIMHEAVYIPESKNVNQLLKEFKQNKVHIAVVLDEYGGTAGIVTLEDILEEIVGEIADEFDGAEEEDQPLRVSEDGWLDLDGRTELEDVAEALDLPIEEDDMNVTIGGFISSNLGRIPKPGEHIELEDFEADIIEADERRLTKLRVRKVDSNDDSSADNRSGAKSV